MSDLRPNADELLGRLTASLEAGKAHLERTADQIRMDVASSVAALATLPPKSTDLMLQAALSCVVDFDLTNRYSPNDTTPAIVRGVTLGLGLDQGGRDYQAFSGSVAIPRARYRALIFLVPCAD